MCIYIYFAGFSTHVPIVIIFFSLVLLLKKMQLIFKLNSKFYNGRNKDEGSVHLAILFLFIFYY